MSDRLSLANRGHLALVLGIMIATGGMCDECGYGTRATGKRWAKCKQCGKRVERKPLAPHDADDSAPQENTE